MVRADADATRGDGESSRARELREALARGEFVTVRAGTYDGWVTAKRRRKMKKTVGEDDGDDFGRVGDNLLETAHANDVELEGACEGSLACSTCHVVFESEDVFASLPEACDDENDMLDLAYGLTDRSRLGCQVTLERGALDGCVVTLPRATRNFAVDGFKPKPH